MEGIAGLSFCACCALSIDEGNKLTHKIKQVEVYLLCVATIRNGQGWVIPEIHQIGGEGNSFHSLHVYHYSISFDKCWQSHAVVHIFTLLIKYTEK